MTEPTHEVEMEAPAIPAELDQSLVLGDSIPEALNKLSDRIDKLQALALEEHARVVDLETALNRIQKAVGRETPEGVEEEIRRLSGLDAEEKRWLIERETILKTVKGLIHKVDSLAGQL
ncbi:MAG: hypothetical protein KJ970_05520 [Candidatus Eisenbacteria bacterium]|uniref:Uncharacterized protein n=1 Tax=Eiseniibacteriota bacterium TaxID=2212470 RepID=A0A948WBW7_UNCEI|nr:hypothetical protein [Candidatus Eisenbacteria bacterium]MBU1949620.1 hypothetical protein [Candidatus Eisenbacteria bacterium]MBU2690368.1 hypothetical protein [Candidatus Eisenbacteria bacterium]